jgi:hypothetical protein
MRVPATGPSERRDRFHEFENTLDEFRVQRVELVLRSSSTNSDARRWLAALSILAGTGATQLAEPVTPQTDTLIMSWDPELIR